MGNNKQKLNVPSKKRNNKKQKVEDVFQTRTVSKRILGMMFVAIFILVILIFRLFYIEVIDGPRLKEMAYKQQTINQIISPARGTIYDSTGKALAISSRVDTVTINPRKN